MLHPRSLAGRIGSIASRRRPSPAMVVALVALFLAAGGVGYAATLPRNSVGTAQIQNGSVTNHKLDNNAVGFRKIIPSTIGAHRVNRDAIQLRVFGNCQGPDQGLTRILVTGRVNCLPNSPRIFAGGQDAPAAITATNPTSPTAITGVSLPGGSAYLVMTNLQIGVDAANGTRGHIAVSCTISVGETAGPLTATTQTRSVSFDVGFGQNGGGTVDATLHQSATLPLQVAFPLSSANAPAGVSCTRALGGTAIGNPTVTAQGTLVAVQTFPTSTLPSTVSPPPVPPAPTKG